jgi:hypothetical protein
MLGLKMVLAFIGLPFSALRCPERSSLVMIACAYFLAPKPLLLSGILVFESHQ